MSKKVKTRLDLIASWGKVLKRAEIPTPYLDSALAVDGSIKDLLEKQYQRDVDRAIAETVARLTGAAGRTP